MISFKLGQKGISQGGRHYQGSLIFSSSSWTQRTTPPGPLVTEQGLITNYGQRYGQSTGCLFQADIFNNWHETSRAPHQLCWSYKHIIKWQCQVMVVHSSSWVPECEDQKSPAGLIGCILVLSHWDFRDLLQLCNLTCLDWYIYLTDHHGGWSLWFLSLLPPKMSWGLSVIISNRE